MEQTQLTHRPDGAPGAYGASARRRRGFTLMELLAVVAIASVLLGIAAPRLLQASAAVSMLNARSRISSAVSLARSASTRYGRVTYVALDVAMDRVRVEVDTTETGSGPPVTVYEADLWTELGVNLQATDPVLCFDPRGFTATAPPCPGRSVVIYVQRGTRSDSVMVSSTGWVS